MSQIALFLLGLGLITIGIVWGSIALGLRVLKALFRSIIP
jgi:hypothetical protein